MLSAINRSAVASLQRRGVLRSATSGLRVRAFASGKDIAFGVSESAAQLWW